MTGQYFGTDGIRGTVGSFPIVPEFCLRLGWAVGKVFSRHGGSHVLIGKDTRISGYMLESALESGLVSAGADVGLMGPMPTPAVAYLTRSLRADAGIVISASHNPYSDNGLKFFNRDGEKLDDAIEAEIERQIGQDMRCAGSGQLGKANRVGEAPGRYIEFCKATLPRNFRLSGLRLVVDCANGATYHVAPRVFEELDASTETFAVAPDGLNINRDCGSTQPEGLANAVLAASADVGIAFDGDGDRVIMVDHTGAVVDGDQILYLIARRQQQTDCLQGGVVGTVMSNLGLEKALTGLGVAFARSPVGDRRVLELLRRQDWSLGGESSGHILCLNLSTTGDGILAALQVLALMVESGLALHDLAQGMQKFPQAIVNVQVGADASRLVCERAAPALAARQRALGARYRTLIRPSGTEPVIRVMVEGEDEADVSSVAEDLARVIERAI